jgi:hypothetical protein
MKSTLCDRKEKVFQCQSTAVMMSITERNHLPTKSVEKFRMSQFERNHDAFSGV